MIHEGQREQATNLRHWPEIVKVELKIWNFSPSQTFVNAVKSETCRCFLGLFICQKQLNTAEINSSLRFVLTLSVLKCFIDIFFYTQTISCPSEENVRLCVYEVLHCLDCNNMFTLGMLGY